MCKGPGGGKKLEFKKRDKAQERWESGVRWGCGASQGHMKHIFGGHVRIVCVLRIVGRFGMVFRQESDMLWFASFKDYSDGWVETGREGSQRGYGGIWERAFGRGESGRCHRGRDRCLKCESRKLRGWEEVRRGKRNNCFIGPMTQRSLVCVELMEDGVRSRWERQVASRGERNRK